MANEITLTASVSLTNGNLKKSFAPGTVQITQTTLGADDRVVSIGTTEEDLAFGDVATLGFLCVRNLDSTNYVQWGPKSAGVMVAIGRLKPGEYAIIRIEPGVTIRAIANTAACKVQWFLLEA